MEVTTGDNFVADDQRVVGDRVDFDFENAAGFREGVAHGAMHLRGAAQRVCILDSSTGYVRLADLAAFEQAQQIRGTFALARMRTDSVNTRVEGARRAF